MQAAVGGGRPALSVVEWGGRDETWMREVARPDGAPPSEAWYERLAQRVLQWEDWWVRTT